MKNKIISLLLVMTMLLSLFTIFPAAETSTAGDGDGLVQNYLHYRNSFGDGLDDTSTSISLINATNSTFEVAAESNGNKYGSFNFNDSKSNVYFGLSPVASMTMSTDKLGYLIFEMDFNALGNLLDTDAFFEIHSGVGTLGESRFAATNVLNIGNNGFRNYVYLSGSTSKRIYIAKDEWVHIRCEMSISSADATSYNFRCYVGDEYFETTFALGTPASISSIRIGSSRSTNQKLGLDNITLYSAKENIPSYEDFLEMTASAYMKIGAENAQINGVKTVLNSAPMLLGEKVYVPVDTLEQISSVQCPDTYKVTLEGAEYICIDDVTTVFNLYAAHYNMGLVIVSMDVLPESMSDDLIVDTLKAFIFNLPTQDSIKNDVKSYTNNFDHPYLLADAEKFAELRTVYTKGIAGQLTGAEDIQLYEYIAEHVSKASSYLSSYCKVSDGTYNGLIDSKIPVNANYDKYNNNGYDNGGRTSIPTTPLMHFAFAYQITGELNYARAAYDYSIALGEWNHWGPAHFLNCADAAAPFAIAYDWLYDAYVALGSASETAHFDGEVYDHTKLAKILLTHAIVPGYIQSNSITCPWGNLYVDSRYANKESNWNAVCTSGMIAATLAIMGEEISVDGIEFDIQTKNGSGGFIDSTVAIGEIGNANIHIGLSTYADYAAKLASMNLASFTKYGLAQYVPDGSYIESPGYWAYGTNALYRMVACLDSATGDDYGIMDAWGIDTTAYFAVHAESSDYDMWSFNDGGNGAQDTSYFFFVGDFYGDENLVRVRKNQLANGKSSTLYDILYYDTSITGDPVLEREYYMQGIDGYAVRSSWNKGALYAAIMGGMNQVSHGHADAGAFVYHNHGRIWFLDFGSDNYNMAGGYFSRFSLYRLSGEGHNALCLTGESDVPYGQLSSTNAPIIDYSTNDANGGYTVIDMQSAYGSHVTSAKRGMLFTDSRSTVVIQDEVVFNGEKTAYWFAHYALGTGSVDKVMISADGRTAFMIGGDDMIRVSIVSENTDLKFEIMDCYTYVLDATFRTDRNDMDGATTEYNRDAYRKLAIKCENVETLNLAVVIETVEDFSLGTDYTWTSMSDWSIEEKTTPEVTVEFEADCESTIPSVGSAEFINTDKLFASIQQIVNGNTFNTVYSAATGTTTEDVVYKLHLKDRYIDVNLYKYVVADIDLYTESAFPAGSTLGFTVGKDENAAYVPIIQLNDRQLSCADKSVTLEQNWKHLTLIYDVKACALHVYVANTRLTTISDVSIDAISSLSIVIPSGTASLEKTSISFDNVKIRSFGTLYDDEKLKEILSAGTSLFAWPDKMSTTPSSAYIAIANNAYLYTYAEVQNALNVSGNKVTLMRDTVGVFNITAPVIVDTNNYDFIYSSNKYMATIVNDVITFGNNSVTVKWHIGSLTVQETYTTSTIATFKQSSSKVGVITEEKIEYADGGYGFIYYTTGWASSKNGKSLSPEEMVVTNNNCEFWLVNNNPIDCLYVVETNAGVFVPYYTVGELIAELRAKNTNRKVVLCSDAELSGTVYTPSTGKNLYLNNHTLSHNQAAHMFSFSASSTANFNIYGPGTIQRDYTTHTVFTSDSATNSLTNQYGFVSHNVTFKIVSMLGDLRIGQHKFYDCDIYQSNMNGAALFDLWNKNTTMINGVPQNLHTITLDGCYVERKVISGSDRAVFAFTSTTYSEVYVVDTTINTPGALIAAASSAVTVKVSGKSAISATKISRTADVEYTAVKFMNGVVTNLQLDSAYRESGSVLAENYNANYPYKVATSYATVNWKNLSGALIHTEFVAVGDTPKPYNSAVTDYISSIYTDATPYKYNTAEVTSTSTINLTPVSVTNSKFMHSMNISSDFALSIYILKSEMQAIGRVIIDGVTITQSCYEEITVNGTAYYKYTITAINPARAGEEHQIVINYLDETEKVISISPVTYLNDLIATTAKESEKILAVKMLKYFAAAYEYTGRTHMSEYAQINAIIDQYTDFDIIFGGISKVDIPDTSVLDHAVFSSRLNLSASARLRLTLNSGFTGKLTVEYLGETYTYVVRDGMYNNNNYIEIQLPASHIMSTVTVSDGTYSVDYSINAYYSAIGSSNQQLRNLLFALGEYCNASNNYLADN